MNHLLLTRFNVSEPAWGDPRHLDDRWLRGRIELFERYTAPAVAAQIGVERFRWVVFVDPQSPHWLVDALQQRLDGIGQLVAVPSQDPKVLRDRCCELVGDGPLLTSRLDSDDVIATDFVARVQRAARRPGFYDFQVGYVLDADTGRVAVIRYPLNMFQSRFSVNGEIVYAEVPGGGVDHTRNDEVAQIHRVPGPVAWLMVAHGSNVSNQYLDRAPISPKQVRRRFPTLPDDVASRSTGEMVRSAVIRTRIALAPARERLIRQMDARQLN